ncbi:MAG: metal-sensitive transcriptional regulator [Nocardioides sp.]|nr:metal-sensitive transcriptional regulator [Nocardioides sp.]
MELDPVEIKPVITRMKRAHGHLGSVIRMMEEGASCEDVLTQLAAVNKAIARASYAVVSSGMQSCMTAHDGQPDPEDLARMEKLFLSLA